MSMSLAQLLARECELVREFIASLTAEQEALKVGNANALPAINQGKTKVVDQLNAVEGQRYGLLRQAGYPGDQEGMQAWLKANRGDRPALSEWAKLMKLAAEARELNSLNGQLITMRLQATNQALASLTRQAQRTSLYGPDGQTSLRTGSRIIDAA